MHAQIDVKIENTVTLGATSLNNNSASYASYAILLDQAIGHQASPPPISQLPNPCLGPLWHFCRPLLKMAAPVFVCSWGAPAEAPSTQG